MLMLTGPSGAAEGDALIAAIEQADPAAVERLLSSGATPDPLRTGIGQSPLEFACTRISDLGYPPDAETPAAKAAIPALRRILAQLLAAGADPNADAFRRGASTTGGQTPLHAGNLALDCLEPLLAAGADPNARMASDLWGAGKGLTVLEAALSGPIPGRDRISGLALLIEAGADPHRNRHDGLSLKAGLAETLSTMLPEQVKAGRPVRAAEVEQLKYMFQAYRALDRAGVAGPDADARMRQMAAALASSLDAAPKRMSDLLSESGQVAGAGLAERIGRSGHLDAKLFQGDRVLSEELPIREVLRRFLETRS
ncbi:MAG: hypothetical protein AB7G39_00415 [Alphaproteobacteria bacterium]